MARVVVLGGGIGGISMAYGLRSKIGHSADITVLSDSEWFQSFP